MRTSRRDRHLASYLDRIRASYLDLASCLDLANDRDRDHARALASDLARDLARALELANDRAPDHALAFALDLASTRALELANALVLARDRDHARALVLARDPDHARALTHARDLVSYLDLASALVLDLDLASASAARPAGRVAPLAGRLLAAAARLLPPGDRARYAEEFRSELAELAAAGAGRRRQLAHAARVAMSARQLRADLRAPRRRQAAP